MKRECADLLPSELFKQGSPATLLVVGDPQAEAVKESKLEGQSFQELLSMAQKSTIRNEICAKQAVKNARLIDQARKANMKA